MKQKIAEALKTKYKSFGLSNEAIDRIASAKEKTVTKEEEIEAGISDVSTMDLIAKELQKMRDTEIQKRTDLERTHNEYKAKHPEQTPPDPTKPDTTQPDLAKTISDAIAAGLKPLQDKIEALENAGSAKEALVSARDKFFGGDYAKKYEDQAKDAWERAVELNEATGSKMTSDELVEKASGYFNKSVSRLGIDTSKPFVPDTPKNEEEGTTDWSDERKRLQEEGRIPKDK